MNADNYSTNPITRREEANTPGDDDPHPYTPSERAAMNLPHSVAPMTGGRHGKFTDEGGAFQKTRRMVIIDRLSDGRFLVDVSEPDSHTGIWEGEQYAAVTLEEALVIAAMAMMA